MKQHHSSTDNATQQTLVAALTEPARYPHPVTTVERLETHISHILLAGSYAYKIKKPLNLEFLDFTSLARRKFYCHEELRLNRRLAPHLYLDAIPICGSPENPILEGNPGEAFEYAVKMQRFAQQNLLDRCLAKGILKPRHIDSLARQLAEFHDTIARAGDPDPFGSPERIRQPALDNFTQTRPLLQEADDLDLLERLESWTIARSERLHTTMIARKHQGFIRECHGDLHLGNMILSNGEITIFDCIEFNDNLRWIDVMNDIGFLVMDLIKRQAPGMAWRLLNGYLEFSGDYEGLSTLPYYQVYRAMVRAKIAAIRRQQPDLTPLQREAVQDECRTYLRLALAFSRRQTPFLMITHGVSGSGKSYLSGQLSETLGIIRLRSDVERKRLFGLGPLDTSASGLGQGLYTAGASVRTYQRLWEQARHLLAAGYAVVVDATFLEAAQRQRFRDLARAQGVPFILLACTADPAILRARIVQRIRRGDDAAEADIAVLERQLQNYNPPAAGEDLLEAQHGDIDDLRKAILSRVHAYPQGGT